ncbi:hypothetical protein AB4865_04605 [Capnocytophaga sp. ARDL2]|uniref:hypothetical protein n=1 Tax=Capnocytophaga sp. ARDL2 TaxID=3238809 RepID=UPI003555F37B
MEKISQDLQKKGIETTYINSVDFTYNYKSIWDKIYNFFSKTFLKKNVKKTFRNDQTLKKCHSLDLQDYILVVNPSHFSTKVINVLRKKTNHFYCLNYDSLERSPIVKEIILLFDKIFSFDPKDVENHSFLYPTTNFNYLDKHKNYSNEKDAFIVILGDAFREQILHKLADVLIQKKCNNFDFVVVNSKQTKKHPNFNYLQHNIPLNEVFNKMKRAKILIDIVHNNQTGVSFRVFEAMALGKKIITNNPSVKLYDFYNPNNICIIDENNIAISEEFLSSPYEELPEEIYQKYTLSQWTKNIFNL